MPPFVANPVLPQRSYRPAVQGDKDVSTQSLPLKGDYPIGEVSTSLLSQAQTLWKQPMANAHLVHGDAWRLLDQPAGSGLALEPTGANPRRVSPRPSVVSFLA